METSSAWSIDLRCCLYSLNPIYSTNTCVCMQYIFQAYTVDEIACFGALCSSRTTRFFNILWLILRKRSSTRIVQYLSINPYPADFLGCMYVLCVLYSRPYSLTPKTLYKKTVQENMGDDRLTNRIFPGPTRYRE